MKTLIIDSATNLLYTSLLDDDVIVYESYVAGKTGHASAILVEIEAACKKCGIELIQINRVVVGYGPGSYTGVRMAVAVGKMIATLEPSIKLYKISTLLLMASGYDGKVLANIDARRGNCFGCIYNTNKNEYVINEALVDKDSLFEQEYDFVVNEGEFKVNPFNVIKLAHLVDEPRLLVPNYLRDTEAERNLNA